MKITHNGWEGLVPSSKHDAVRKALYSVFGTAGVTEAARLAGGGSSAIVLRIVANDTPFVLRVIPQIHELNDPDRQYACLPLAAEVSIGPQVYEKKGDDLIAPLFPV